MLLHVALTFIVVTYTLNPLNGIFSLLALWVTDSERCDSNWISFSETELAYDLEHKLFGQHIAADVLLKTVKGFMSNNDPQKPLVLSLNGRTGTGKNYAVELVANSIYREGMNSNYVHIFSADHHFQNLSDVENYKDTLREYIVESVSRCERSMFVFDEVEKMDPGLLDIIKPYLDYYNNLDGVSYRKSIFIFLR